MYALSNEKPDKGNLRETFILNQLLVKNSVSYPEIGDFLINGKYLIEVGGPSKKTKQITSLENAFIAADDIEFPDGKKYRFGCLDFCIKTRITDYRVSYCRYSMTPNIRPPFHSFSVSNIFTLSASICLGFVTTAYQSLSRFVLFRGSSINVYFCNK